MFNYHSLPAFLNFIAITYKKTGASPHWYKNNQYAACLNTLLGNPIMRLKPMPHFGEYSYNYPQKMNNNNIKKKTLNGISITFEGIRVSQRRQ